MVKIDFIFYLILVTVGYICGVFIYHQKILKNHGPDSNHIRNIKFNHNNKCYKFKPYVRPCSYD